MTKDKLKLLLFTVFVVSLTMVFISLFNTSRDVKLYFLSSIIVTALVFLYVVTNRIHEKYLEEDPVLMELKQELVTCFPEIDNAILLKGKKSYTINKKQIYICLKDEKGEYYNKNMLKYVILHELAHVLCDEIGHTEKFHKIFEDILRKAIKCGVYDDRIPTIKNYCEY